MLSSDMANVTISIPIVMDCPKLSDETISNNFFRDDIQRFGEARDKERPEIFAVDNFLCSLLLYGAPLICQKLLTDIFMKHIIESSELAKYRVEVIKEVKRLGIIKIGRENLNISKKHIDDSENINVKSMVTFIPKLENENLRAQVAQYIKKLIKESPISEVRILHTKESHKHAEDIILEVERCIRRDVNVTPIQVERGFITTKIERLITNELKEDVILLIIGEFPKRELLKLIDVALSHPVKLRLLMWRPRIQKSSGEAIKDIRDKCSLGEVEKPELRAVSI